MAEPKKSLRLTISDGCSASFLHGQRAGNHWVAAQNAFFNADTGNAFTTVLAGLAFTMTTLPKTSLFPAFVAGFKRVLCAQAGDHKLSRALRLLGANFCQALHCLRTHRLLKFCALRERLSKSALGHGLGTGLHCFHGRHYWRWTIEVPH